MKFRTTPDILITDIFTGKQYRADGNGILEIKGNTFEEKDFIKRCKNKLEQIEEKREKKEEKDNNSLSYTEIKAKIKQICEDKGIETPKGYTRMSKDELTNILKELEND